jgi:hypothetical protein
MDGERGFALDVGDGTVIDQIMEISGMRSDQDVIELKQNAPDGKIMIKKLANRPGPGEIALVRSQPNDGRFARLMRDAGGATPRPFSGALGVLDASGTVIERYRLTDAVPRRLDIDAARLTETLVLHYRAIERAE